MAINIASNVQHIWTELYTNDKHCYIMLSALFVMILSAHQENSC